MALTVSSRSPPLRCYDHHRECAFGGPDLTDLYITTAGDFWPSEYEPLGCDPEKDNVGGALYRVQLDIPGKPEQRTRF